MNRVGWVATGMATISGLAVELGHVGGLLGWVAAGRPSILGNADEQGGLGSNSNNLRSGRGAGWVGVQQVGCQSWVIVRRLGCRRKGINSRTG